MVRRIIFVFTIALYASVHLHAGEAPLEKMLRLYKKERYKEACNWGLRYFNRYKKEGNFIMLYAFSCLHSDYIDRLAVPMTALRYTPTERKNATYFATILLQKKMLYQKLLDGLDLTAIRLPETDYVLSIVFDMITKNQYTKKNNAYLLTDRHNPKKSYKLYLETYSKGKHMILQEYLDGKLIKTHRYW